jgi:hypothetical protein
MPATVKSHQITHELHHSEEMPTTKHIRTEGSQVGENDTFYVLVVIIICKVTA